MEQPLILQTLSHLVGVDEVGRGCWAGPLVAGAVLLNAPIAGLRDSKQLTKTRRESLAAQITATADYGLGWVWPVEVDRLGLTASVGLAMHRALTELGPLAYDQLVIDGNYNFFPEDARAVTCVKADALVPAVSAASILAKVARDRYMAAMARNYPAYGFERHVGYGTAEHVRALKLYGITPEHRLSYRPIRTILAA